MSVLLGLLFGVFVVVGIVAICCLLTIAYIGLCYMLDREL